METKIYIKDDMIQLNQLLKLANVIESGGHIRMLIEEQKIRVNGELCTAKRKQLHEGDVVDVEGAGCFIVTTHA